MEIVNWFLKNWAAVLLLFAGICACIATFYLSKQDQNQKDNIENLSKENTKLSIEIKKLNNINNEISNRIESLSMQNKVLIENVKDITTKASQLIEKIESTTTMEANENRNTDELIMRFSEYYNDSTLRVLVGSNTFYVELNDTGSYIFNYRNDKILFARSKDGKILFSCDIYDAYGNIIAEIKDNCWRPNRNFVSKINYDATGFEVLNNQNQVALSVDFLGDNLIKIQGIFVLKKMGMIYLVGDSIMTALELSRTDDLPNMIEKTGFRKIFIYTGINYLHQRAK